MKDIVKRAFDTKYHGESVEILKCQNVFLDTRNLNFLSKFFKMSVIYAVRSNENDGKAKSERSECIAIKTEPVEIQGALDLVRKQNLFSTELRILRDVLPRIEQLVARQIGPSLWYGCDDPAVLVMGDLTKHGFIMKDCQKGLSIDHCALFMERIASLHAGSVKLAEEDPELVRSFTDGIVSENCPVAFKRLMEVSLIRVGNTVARWSDEKCRRAAGKLSRLAETIGARCKDAYDYVPGEFCVLNHGDCWVNNMMFRENENGRPYDMILVDYQMTVYTSPAIDLIYFLNTSPAQSIKYDKDDWLLQVYLNSLRNTMERIECKTRAPTMEELKAAIHKRRIYAVFSGIVLYLRMIAEKEDVENFDVLLSQLCGETRMDVFKNPAAISATLKMLPVMDDRGYLD